MVDLYAFKASLVYIGSPGQPGLQRGPVSKNQIKSAKKVAITNILHIYKYIYLYYNTFITININV